MALYAKVGHRLAMAGFRNIGPGRVGGISFARLYLDSRKMDDHDVPEGYGSVHLTKKDLPAFYDKTKPLTPERRAELAAKYNMLPEDYQPMEDFGDYPELPIEGANDRDPWYDWDDEKLRRNYGEPIMFDQDWYDRLSSLDKAPQMLDRSQQIKILSTIFGFFIIMAYLGSLIPSFKAVGPHQYPEYYASDDRVKNSIGPYLKFYGRKDVVNYSFPGHHQH